MSSSMEQILSYTRSKPIINLETSSPRIHHAKVFSRNISNTSILMMVPESEHHTVFSSIPVFCQPDTRMWSDKKIILLTFSRSS